MDSYNRTFILINNETVL